MVGAEMSFGISQHFQAKSLRRMQGSRRNDTLLIFGCQAPIEACNTFPMSAHVSHSTIKVLVMRKPTCTLSAMLHLEVQKFCITWATATSGSGSIFASRTAAAPRACPMFPRQSYENTAHQRQRDEGRGYERQTRASKAIS